MKREGRTWLVWVALAICATVAGCDAQQTPGAAQMVVTLPQSLSASDIARVDLTVSAEGMDSRTVALVKTGAQWGGVVGNLPAGGGRNFSAQAFDVANTLIYTGQVTGVTITADQTTAVTLVLQEVNAPAPFENAAPVITSVVASRSTVRPGGVVALQAAAQDANAGDSLTYAWTAGAGSLGAASSQGTEWTAPATSGPVVLTLTVTDSKGATAALSLTLTVSAGTGSAAVNVTVNTWPQVSRVTATPSTVAVGEATTVVASASDNDSDSLGYQWTAGCAGTWANATSASASFTPTAQPPAGSLCASCALTVTVADDRGGQAMGTLSICVGPKVQARFAPEVVESFQSSTGVPASGGTVDFRVRARDRQSSALTFSWESNVGTLGTATSAATTSEVTWRAPACAPTGTTPTVTVTVSNALGLSTATSFTLQGATVCVGLRGASIVASALHTVALRPDGTVWAWGSNSDGQLGDGTRIDRYTPTQVPGLTGVISIAAGTSYTLAVRQDGTVWFWGSGWVTPVQSGLTEVSAIATSGHHTLVLKRDGTVWAWGDNSSGQLGNGTTTSPSTPMQVQGLTGVIAIAASTLGMTWGFSIAVRQDGTVWAWGSNIWGQLGDGTIADRHTPVQVPGLTDVTAIAVGTRNTVALRQDGTIRAWGMDSDRLRQDLTGVTAIAANDSHIVAVRLDGTVWAWGDNTWGQLGDGTTTSRSTPVQVQELAGGPTIAVGAAHTVAMSQEGTVWAWGLNWDGQLGDGPPATRRLTPVQVQGVVGSTTIAATAAHTVALAQNGTVWAWGRNAWGQLGDGTMADRLTPTQVQGLTDVTAIAASAQRGDHTVAVKQDGTVWAWGSNVWGQLGDGTTTSRSTPVQVQGLTEVTAITVGETSVMAVRQDGTVWFWGSGRITPEQLPGLTEVSAIAAGGRHRLALKRDGTVWAWGDNTWGQLGDGTTTSRSTPVQVPGLTGVVAITADPNWHSGFSVALRQDGTVWAWGSNVWGQLGDGSGIDRHTPVQVPGLTDVTAIAVGDLNTVVLKQDGTVWAWGLNTYGKLGDGTLAHRSTPVQVQGLTGVTAIATSIYHTVAVRQDGTAWAWGFNPWGQLGDGTTGYRSTPVQVIP